jgi:hypothetical protein
LALPLIFLCFGFGIQVNSLGWEESDLCARIRRSKP